MINKVRSQPRSEDACFWGEAGSAEQDTVGPNPPPSSTVWGQEPSRHREQNKPVPQRFTEPRAERQVRRGPGWARARREQAAAGPLRIPGSPASPPFLWKQKEQVGLAVGSEFAQKVAPWAQSPDHSGIGLGVTRLFAVWKPNGKHLLS